MRVKYAVTFEQWTTPPETVRGVVEAGVATACARLAVRAAMDARPGQRWRSLVILLEREESESNTGLEPGVSTENGDSGEEG